MVNSTYIAAANNFWNMFYRYGTETGFFFTDGLLIIVCGVSLLANAKYGAGNSIILAGFWGLIASSMLWLAGFSDYSRPLFMFAVIAIGVMVKRLIET